MDATQRGRQLEYWTIGYNVLECGLALLAGWIAGSVSLTGFGIDSGIEVTSSAAVLWRLRSGPQREKLMLRIIGICFLALAAYLAVEAGERLWTRAPAKVSWLGIALACASLLIMPWLSREKRKVGTALGSATVLAGARQTDFCAYLSAILLAGLLANATFGWTWLDPAAALIMCPIIVREGILALRGQSCCHACQPCGTPMPPAATPTVHRLSVPESPKS